MGVQRGEQGGAAKSMRHAASKAQEGCETRHQHPLWLRSHAAPVMLAQQGCYMTSRGGFATKHIWVTRYAPDARYASGEFPNQHAGGAARPTSVAQNRLIETQDIVVSHRMAATHVSRPEDIPVT